MPVQPTHRVAVTSLTFRSEPQIRPGNRLAILPFGTGVERLEAHDESWWRVRVRLQEAEAEGFVASRFLEEADDSDFTPPPAAFDVPAVHLREGREDVRRDRANRRAFPIGEPGAPRRTSEDPFLRSEELTAILDWLTVEGSARYQPTGRLTFCNIYAYDVCYAAGVYLPRVWWMSGALIRIMGGEQVPVRYGETVEELTANRLSRWLVDFGAVFGWRRTLDFDELQSAANQGQLGLIVARHHRADSSGHIAVIDRETENLQARREEGKVLRPITSQAGRENFRRRVPDRVWWALPPHAEWSAWIHH